MQRWSALASSLSLSLVAGYLYPKRALAPHLNYVPLWKILREERGHNNLVRFLLLYDIPILYTFLFLFFLFPLRSIFICGKIVQTLYIYIPTAYTLYRDWSKPRAYYMYLVITHATLFALHLKKKKMNRSSRASSQGIKKRSIIHL